MISERMRVTIHHGSPHMQSHVVPRHFFIDFIFTESLLIYVTVDRDLVMKNQEFTDAMNISIVTCFL